jgi:hypothetical protein
MKAIKLIAVLISFVVLTTSCYTQLALVEHDNGSSGYSDNGYYYPQSDTLYGDEGQASIIQNFYLDYPPYRTYDPFWASVHIGFYNDWWMWNDFYYSTWPYYMVGLRPVFLYPIPGIWAYDPFYDFYDPYWGYSSGPYYRGTYGPRPFHKGGSLIRGGGSKRVRLSKISDRRGDYGSSGFIPTRAAGGSLGTGKRSMAIRKTRSGSSIQTSGTAIRKTGSTSRGKIVRKSHDRSVRRSSVVRRRSSNTRRYFPITTGSSQPKRVVKQQAPKKLKQVHTVYNRGNSRRKQTGTYESHRWTPPSRSSHVTTSRPSYSAPSRSSTRSTSVHRSSSTSSRSSGSRRAVRKH